MAGWEEYPTSSLSSSTLLLSSSSSCSTISLGPLVDAALTSSSCPVICETDAANRFIKTCQLSSLYYSISMGAILKVERGIQIVKKSGLFNKTVKNSKQVCFELAS